MVDDLEARGLATRHPNPHDRRAHALHPTPAGRALLQRSQATLDALDTELTGDLTPAQLRTLTTLLAALVSHTGLLPGVHPGVQRPPAASTPSPRRSNTTSPRQQRGSPA